MFGIVNKKMMNTTYKISTQTGLVLLLFTSLCRFSKTIADVYATKIYPAISCVLSWLSSFVSLSLQDFAIFAIITAAFAIVVLARRRKWSFLRCLRYEATIVLWTYLWFYIGWCTNYTRNSLYEQTGAKYTAYDEATFLGFAEEFIKEINVAWMPMPTDANMIDSVYCLTLLEKDVKDFYASVPSHYELATPQSWQHPKQTIFNRYYSYVGVLGYIAPLFSESCLNADILPYDYPFVYAHEYAHLLGVSNEAEANWWAFQACSKSGNAKVRYSAYKGILQYILINARGLLSERQFASLLSSIRPEVLDDITYTQRYWGALRSPMLDNLQSKIYDSFLRGNAVEAGIKNYTQVVGLLINIRYDAKK